MNILIVGEHGTGKSNMVDLLRNMIYKLDKDCTITTNDPDKTLKSIGSGNRQHNVMVVTPQDEKTAVDVAPDIRVELVNQDFKKWFDEVS